MAKQTKTKKVEPTIEEKVASTFSEMEKITDKVLSEVETPEVIENKVETPEVIEDKVETPEVIEDKVETPEVIEDKVETPEVIETKVETPEVIEDKVETPETKVETPEVIEDKVEDESEDELVEGDLSIKEKIMEIIVSENFFNYVSFGRHLNGNSNERVISENNLKLFADEFSTSGMLTSKNHYDLLQLFKEYYKTTEE